MLPAFRKLSRPAQPTCSVDGAHHRQQLWSTGGGVLGGFGTWQPLVPELHCREERLMLMQSRARRAGRKAAARVGGSRQGTSRHPWWSGGAHGGYARHGVWEPGEGSGRHCLLVPSAGMGLAALPACCTAHMHSSSPRNSISSGDPLHTSLP